MNANRLFASSKIQLVLAAAALLTLVAPAIAPAAVVVHTGKSDDSGLGNAEIKGDCTLKGYAGAIEAQSVDFGLLSPEGVKPMMTDMTIIKSVDGSSAELAFAGFTGKVLETVEIFQLRTGNGKEPAKLFKLTLNQVRISSFSVVATEDDPASESITFEYKNMTIETFKQGKGGKVSSSGKTTLK